MINIQTFKDKVREQTALYKMKKKQYVSNENKLSELNDKYQILELVNEFFSVQIKEKTKESKYKLESLVNQGLHYIFSDTIHIVINSSIKNNKTCFSLSIVKDGINEGMSESFGGGVLAVIAVILKISTILITNKERLLVLDESLAYVSKEYQEKLSIFLKQICKQLNFDIILIAHQPTLVSAADILYEAAETKNGVVFNKIKTDKEDND